MLFILVVFYAISIISLVSRFNNANKKAFRETLLYLNSLMFNIKNK